MSERKLTAKRVAFVQEYLIDLNGTQAAIRAGYSPNGAEVTASKLLIIAKVSQAIQKAQEERSKRTAITTDYVVKGLNEIAQRCLQRKPVMVRSGKDWVQDTDEDGEGVWQFDASGANRSFELLGKHTGAFKERVELSGPDGAPVQIEHMTDDELRRIIASGKP